MAQDAQDRDRFVAALKALVHERVRIRFTLTAADFVTHLLQQPGFAAEEDTLAHARALHLDDLYLATACLQQDEAAWAECGQEHFEFMRDFAGRILPRDSAREVTDTVIADLWRRGKLARYEGRSSLRTWLGAVTAHAALNAAKTHGRAPSVSEATNRSPAAERTTSGRPEQQESARLLSVLVAEAIAALNPEDRLLLLLHYEQEMPLERIAPLLDTSKATLSRRLKRIRGDMRQMLERLTMERYGSSATDVRKALDLGDVEFDLSLLLRGTSGVKGSGGDAV